MAIWKVNYGLKTSPIDIKVDANVTENNIENETSRFRDNLLIARRGNRVRIKIRCRAIKKWKINIQHYDDENLITVSNHISAVSGWTGVLFKEHGCHDVVFLELKIPSGKDAQIFKII
jgi:hypothetical protein